MSKEISLHELDELSGTVHAAESLAKKIAGGEKETSILMAYKEARSDVEIKSNDLGIVITKTKNMGLADFALEITIDKDLKLTGRDLAKFIFENKECYKGKTIRGLDIWGIGPQAITLGHVKTGDGYTGPDMPNIWCEDKEFHNFFRKINKGNSFNDGLKVAEEIVEKYGYITNEEEKIKYMNEAQGMD